MNHPSFTYGKTADLFFTAQNLFAKISIDSSAVFGEDKILLYQITDTVAGFYFC